MQHSLESLNDDERQASSIELGFDFSFLVCDIFEAILILDDDCLFCD